MAFTRLWDEALPKDQDRVFTGAQEIRNLKIDFRERVDNRCPIGGIIEWPTETVPGMFLECDGSAISRSTYIDLYAVIGETFGSGDGSTTFNIPDLRGLFVSGLPQGSIDPDVAATTFVATTTSGSPTLTTVSMTALPRIGSSLSGTGIPVGTKVSTVDVNGVTVTMTANATATSAAEGVTVTFNNDAIGTVAIDQTYKHVHTYEKLSLHTDGLFPGRLFPILTQTSVAYGTNETRPTNTYVMYIIRATAL